MEPPPRAGYSDLPQPVSREAGGLRTGIGYGYQEDQYRNDTEYTIMQRQGVSELGDGVKNWV